jgi:hypothetical protein
LVANVGSKKILKKILFTVGLLDWRREKGNCPVEWGEVGRVVNRIIVQLGQRQNVIVWIKAYYDIVFLTM